MFLEMTLTQQQWINKEWPIRNGLYFDDESLILLDLGMPWDTGLKAVSITISGTERISGLKEIQDGFFSRLAITCEDHYPALDRKVCGGEGSRGSDGFVALSKISSDKLIWLAFFECSNPFIKVSSSGGFVTAVSNLQLIWSFPIQKPETVTVLTKP